MDELQQLVMPGYQLLRIGDGVLDALAILRRVLDCVCVPALQDLRRQDEAEGGSEFFSASPVTWFSFRIAVASSLTHSFAK